MGGCWVSLGLAMPQPTLCAFASLELLLRIEVTASETSSRAPTSSGT